MSKTLELSHGERFELSKILNEAKFSQLSDMAHALEDAKNIAHNPEETKKIDINVINEGKNITWNEDGDLKSIELSDATVKAATDNIKAKEAAGEITLGDSNLITLQAKLTK